MSSLNRLLSRRYLFARKGRVLATLFGIALGVTMVVAVALMNSAIRSSYENLVGGVAGRADLQVTGGTAQGFAAFLLPEVAKVAGVKAAVPSVSNGSLVLVGDKKSNATFYGIDPNQDGLIRDYRLKTGRLVAASGEVAVTDELAQSLGLHLGDALHLLSTQGQQKMTVVGIFDARGTVRGSLGPFGVVPLADAQRIFGKADKLDTVDILLAPGHGKEDVQKAVEKALNGRAQVGEPMERTESLQSILFTIFFTLTMAGAVSLFAGAFIIYTNVSMGVAERRRDLAILRAVGMRRREVLALVLGEAAVQGLLGGLLGLGLGYGLASSMTQQLTAQFLTAYGIQASQVVVDSGDVLLALAVGLGAALVAAYGPAQETLRFSPVEAMRPGELASSAERYGWKRAMVGLAMLAAGAATIWGLWPKQGMMPHLEVKAFGGAVMLALAGVVILLPILLPWLSRFLLSPLQVALHGVTGRLAAENLLRQPRRTAATIAALLVSLTFMVGIGGMGASQRGTIDTWLHHMVGWDLHVSTSFVGMTAQVEMDEQFVQELSTVPGVKLFSPQKFRVIDKLSDGQPAYLQAFDHALVRQYSTPVLVEGDWKQAADEMEKGGSVLISSALAHRMNLHLGDSLQLPTPTGEHAFRVIGVMKDIMSVGGTVQMERKDYVQFWQDRSSSAVALVLTDKTQASNMRQKLLDRWGESHHLMVRTQSEFFAEIKNEVEGFYKLMDGLNWISILVSCLAIANTLFASILERKREFAMLRAVGTRRSEIVRVVLGEALGTGIVGGIFGLLCGLALQWLFVRSSEFVNGSSTDWVFSWGIILTAVVISVFFAPLAGLLPARRAARLDVVEALRYE